MYLTKTTNRPIDIDFEQIEKNKIDDRQMDSKINWVGEMAELNNSCDVYLTKTTNRLLTLTLSRLRSHQSLPDMN